ncbi:DNA mismatch repair protein MutS [Massilia sp. CCM 8733]|uniref:DNA mismatch repair protein MutS n=1 Tax=Massilia mucilaginosa TaxID=2609282 RepID=A0ABX0P3T0_9BURK|nr:Smr/MutS family protein [Massilia mucilaginosa]NHZ93470.1 DNA mismatch repair protein MutS [Massilia mucilaginosa]
MPMKDFSDLKSLREQLKGQDEARAREKAEREERQRVAVQEANLFNSAIGGVKKMPESNRFVPNAPPGVNVKIKPAKVFRSQAEDDAAVLRESLSDQFEVDHLLEDDPSLSFSRAGIGPDVVRKLRKGYWPVQDELDLHGLRRDGAREAIGDFLHKAGKRKLRCVCVIHGKGLGSAGGEPVLRSMVHSWLEQKDEVIAFCAANVDGRSHGALIVLLKSAIGT